MWRRRAGIQTAARVSVDRLTLSARMPFDVAVALGFDRSSVAPHEILHQREADAEALARALRRLVDLNEKIPDVRELLVCILR